MNARTKRILGAVTRHAIAAGGVYLASKGVPPEALELIRDDLARVSGGGASAAVLAWSIWEKARRDRAFGSTRPAAASPTAGDESPIDPLP
jgi:hypothetical protein